MLNGTAFCQFYTLRDSIFDLMASEVVKGRECDTLKRYQQIELNAMGGLLQAQAVKINIQSDELTQYKEKERLWGLQFQNQGAINEVEKKIAKTRLKSVKRWLGVSVGVNVLLVVLLL